MTQEIQKQSIMTKKLNQKLKYYQRSIQKISKD